MYLHYEKWTSMAISYHPRAIIDKVVRAICAVSNNSNSIWYKEFPYRWQIAPWTFQIGGISKLLRFIQIRSKIALVPRCSIFLSNEESILHKHTRWKLHISKKKYRSLTNDFGLGFVHTTSSTQNDYWNSIHGPILK